MQKGANPGVGTKESEEETVKQSSHTWTPKSMQHNGLNGCYYGFRVITCFLMAAVMGLGLLFYILLGSRYLSSDILHL